MVGGIEGICHIKRYIRHPLPHILILHILLTFRYKIGVVGRRTLDGRSYSDVLADKFLIIDQNTAVAPGGYRPMAVDGVWIGCLIIVKT